MCVTAARWVFPDTGCPPDGLSAPSSARGAAASRPGPQPSRQRGHSGAGTGCCTVGRAALLLFQPSLLEACHRACLTWICEPVSLALARQG